MKLIKKILLLLVVVLLLIIGTFAGLGYKEYHDATSETSLEAKVKEIQSQKHYVTYDEISPYLLDATVAIEDHRFYDHGGVDYISLVRALVSNVEAKGIVGGGSTITQQLAKNMYFGYEPSMIRKVAEVFVAKELERKYSKKEILELYVNIINYGDGHMGIYEASFGYFNCEPSKLSLAQSSLIAGIPQSPSNLQLSNNYKRAKTRQKAVLEAMVKEAMIPYVESVQAQSE